MQFLDAIGRGGGGGGGGGGEKEEKPSNSNVSFLPMPLVFSINDQSKLRKSLSGRGQCFDRVMFCLKRFDLNDFSLKLTKS